MYTYTYRLDTGVIEGCVNTIVPNAQEAPEGYGLYRVPDLINEDGTITHTYPQDGKMIDISQETPVPIDIPT